MTLALDEWGAQGAPRIVCLHGVRNHGLHFAPLAAELPEYHVVALDLLGHGDSPWEPPWDIGAHLDAIVETVGVRESVLIGHSFGGRLAFELAARAPKLVPKLVLLVFHPFAFTPVCEDEARDLQENLPAFRDASTEIVFVSCDPSAARQAWKKQIGAEFTFASDFWPHGAAAKAYGVFNEATGAPHRGTFLIDREGTVIWSLVKENDEYRAELVPDSLDTLGAKA